MTPLRRRLIDELTRRNDSPRTVEACVAGVARAARHFGRPPDQLTPDDLRAFQLHRIATAVRGPRRADTGVGVRAGGGNRSARGSGGGPTPGRAESRTRESGSGRPEGGVQW